MKKILLLYSLLQSSLMQSANYFDEFAEEIGIPQDVIGEIHKEWDPLRDQLETMLDYSNLKKSDIEEQEQNFYFLKLEQFFTDDRSKYGDFFSRLYEFATTSFFTRNRESAVTPKEEKKDTKKEDIIAWIRKIIFERKAINQQQEKNLSQPLRTQVLSKSNPVKGLKVLLRPSSCVYDILRADQVSQVGVRRENFSLMQKTVIPQVGAQCGKEAMVNARNVIAEFLGKPKGEFVSGKFDRDCDWLEAERLGQLWEEKYGKLTDDVFSFAIVTKDLKNMYSPTVGVELSIILESSLNQPGKKAFALFINTADQEITLETALQGATVHTHWFTVVILKEDGPDKKPFIRFVVMDSLGNLKRTNDSAVLKIIDEVKKIFKPTVLTGNQG